ncbi:MAG: Na+/H+ antiporter subunit E [Bacteroidales bacterium]|nr:Na+/H+ antiporter subunit E [Bacteroidales bacterium]
MNTFFQHLFLTFIWVALTMSLTIENFLFGFVAAFFVLWFVKRKSKDAKYFNRVPKTLSFLFLFVKEVIKGSLKIGYDIITPSHYMNPGIIAVPLDAATDLEITLLANSITLTPGTTSLAVSEDRSTLYVYNVYIDKTSKNNNVLDIKNGLEKKLLEVLR